MKWLLILFSIFKPFFTSGNHEMPNPMAELKEMIKANAVKVMIAFTCATTLAIIFAAGITGIALEFANQYEMKGFIYFSPMSLACLNLILVPLIIGAIAVKVLNVNSEKMTVKKEILAEPGATHPLQEALVLLVHDFVKEREMRRTQEEIRTPNSETRRSNHSKASENISTPDNFGH